MSDADLVLARARAAWNAAKRDDDENVREASELRLVRAWPKPRVAPSRAFALGAAAAFAIAALVFFVVRPRAVPAPPVVVTTATPPPVTAPPPAPPVPAPAPRRIARIVASSACAECKIEPGAPIEPRVVVPSGSRLTLGFAFDDGLVDPAMGADVVGPAVAASGPEGLLVVERGTVRLRALRDSVVQVPGGKLSAVDAVYALRVDDRGVARIDVERGRVSVTTKALEIVAHAGGAPLEIDAAGGAHAAGGSPSATVTAMPVAPVPTVVPAPQPTRGEDDQLADARVRARQGDASGRSELERLATSSDVRVARRASFTLAELELATPEHGHRDRARARLDDLLVCPEASLALDAATLLARSYKLPAERADVWRRYLATSPPRPYSDRAQLERADALLDAGRAAEARRILDELRRTGGLGGAQERQLDRLLLKAKDTR